MFSFSSLVRVFFHNFRSLLPLGVFWWPFGVSVVSLACWCHSFGCLWLAWAVCGLPLLLFVVPLPRLGSLGSLRLWFGGARAMFSLFNSFKRASRSHAKTGFAFSILLCVQFRFWRLVLLPFFFRFWEFVGVPRGSFWIVFKHLFFQGGTLVFAHSFRAQAPSRCCQWSDGRSSGVGSLSIRLADSSPYATGVAGRRTQ